MVALWWERLCVGLCRELLGWEIREAVNYLCILKDDQFSFNWSYALYLMTHLIFLYGDLKYLYLEAFQIWSTLIRNIPLMSFNCINKEIFQHSQDNNPQEPKSGQFRISLHWIWELQHYDFRPSQSWIYVQLMLSQWFWNHGRELGRKNNCSGVSNFANYFTVWVFRYEPRLICCKDWCC